MRVAMVASECEPFAKTGGLADVVDALSRELGRQGHAVDVYLPRYRGVEPPAGSTRTRLPLDSPVELVTGDADGYRIRLVDHAPSFDRSAYYGDANGDFPDNGRRFTLLGRAALAAIDAERDAVDILHGHDWQSGPALMLARERSSPATVLTCHNLAYHGWVQRAEAIQAALPGLIPNAEGIDLLREGIRSADLVNTVSETYARATLTPEFGAGLDDVLRSLGDRYLGILNGLDTELWDPARDPIIPARYSHDDVGGKGRCKADLVGRHGLDPGSARWGERGAPLFGMVGRLDPQKGFDLLTGAAEDLIEMDARLVVLGTGDHSLMRDLQVLAARRPDRLAVIDRFDRDEARRIYAGADVFLMPSRFEPSGQGQMISFRYGTVPLVRRTGGLADTVFDADSDAAHGNGFVFSEAQPHALVEAARRAVRAYEDPARWARLIQVGMGEDFSWRRPVQAYVTAYERALALRRSRVASGGSAAAAP